MDLTTLMVTLELILVAFIVAGTYSYGSSIATGSDFSLEFYSADIAILVDSMASNRHEMEVQYELPKDYSMNVKNGAVVVQYDGDASFLKGSANVFKSKAKPTINNPDFIMKSEKRDGNYVIIKERKK